jgi:alkanesulfonate monooxygenase SsuD/methylene tetrahydromethanopterin reductase-like flavin-dependent oxidoreductase (luciferase family)
VSSATRPWLGLMLPVQDMGVGFDRLLDLAGEAEAVGFDSVWVGDHLSFRRPVVEAVVTASMIAARTKRVEIGFGVLQLAMRHPVWLAKQLTTLATLSGGRIQVGVGIGGENPIEWRAAGVPRDQRVERTVELAALLPMLLSGEAVDHVGTHYQFESMPLLPAPAVRPRLWMGGRSDGALRRAAALADGWLGLWVDEDRLTASIERIERDADAADRPPPQAALVVPVRIDEDEAACAEAFSSFARIQYGIDHDRIARWCLGGGVERVGERLHSLVEAGAEGLVLMPAATDPLPMLDQLAALRRQLV